jgi:hypothetical protein
MWSTFGSSVSGHGSFFTSQTASWSSVRATSRPQTDDRTGLSVGLRPGADPAIEVIVATTTTLPRRYRLSEVDASGDALSAPITVNDSSIDARNGQAYHGRKTTTTNETRPALARSRASEGQRAKWQQRRRLTSRVRPCPGAPGCARVLRVGAEAAVAHDSVRCLK